MQSAARLIGSSALALAALAAGSVQAADFGHARLASAVGEPLLILVPVSDLTAADLQALSARPAPVADWTAAGLTPPVALDSLNITVTPSAQAGARRVLRVASTQAFSGTLADLLLDVQMATGAQRYQVSLVAPGPLRVDAPASQSAAPAQAGTAPAIGAAAKPSSIRRVPAGAIAVRSGDTMFAIARRHAVDGVSVYQLMMALQRANPQAFIHSNINLVRAGASLAVPSVDDMLSISDAQARQQFHDQTVAFARLRGRQADAAANVGAQAAGGAVSSDAKTPAQSAGAGAGDRVQLSQGGASSAADARAAQGHALQDAESRVGQLQDNVQNLNKALQSQGEAARTAAAHGAQVLGQSLEQVASAISEAGRESAAQANPQASSPSASADGQPARGATTAQAGDAATAAGATGGAATGGAAGSSGAQAGQAGAQAGAAGTAAGQSGKDIGAGPGLAPQGPAAAAASELQASPQAEHRVSWIQDHLLWVMTALLAVIVFIIAWLLRRANTTRDDTDDSPQITEAMVRDKLQGVDLELPSRDDGQAPPQA
ncbi:MAG: FimV/HubP family polar landmark protein [Castellaniella sp.]|uniref:type IV pilus assembly protein FimV n=1 Tax=Castellaniella sp. TaxID=1955812 RepID=UPI003C735F7C